MAEHSASRSFAPLSGLPAISPTGGEIGCHDGFRPTPTVAERAPAPKPPISPLVGEMSGRTERGAKEFDLA
ncbi:hypothetical protein EN829_026985 [Mesorhizobium sp. M00.F.Ca.ET.186.01.1.1]|nr:hypothetical protein EN848_26160 [bacterium M00.F.Ca.ET.205.01.1.1]TGU48547.1 hypothetical protein EN795_27440 [bacterium M00.F.Ca.ET.152.01.1.1]TGV32802.1 hypothetical protein EN829_026985 [Mesorhizobium sp. M00.F.Ca.ET.186.01.1.1]TGZ40064.1 hypothetical protein EN805_26835 [bacterium M00.F.Ca.ET.162.01.1.1]